MLAEFTVEGSNRRTVGVSVSYSGAGLSLGYLFRYVSRKIIALRALISDVLSLGITAHCSFDKGCHRRH